MKNLFYGILLVIMTVFIMGANYYNSGNVFINLVQEGTISASNINDTTDTQIIDLGKTYV